jgi:hypothetical protein
MSAGGPATAVWAWFIGSIMAYCIASSGQSPKQGLGCSTDDFSCGASVSISNSWRYVLCDETCSSSRARRALGLDNWVVQLSRSGRRSRKSCIYYLADDSSYGGDAFHVRGWRAHVYTVSNHNPYLGCGGILSFDTGLHYRRFYLLSLFYACLEQYAPSLPSGYTRSSSGLLRSTVSRAIWMSP